MIYGIQLFYYFFRSVAKPEELKFILKIGDLLRKLGAFEISVEKIKSLPGGQGFFKKTSNFRYSRQYFAQFPDGSLGHKYYKHLTENNLDPEVFPVLEHNSDACFLEDHIRQVHDVLHVVTNFGISVPDEIGLQAFKAKQIHWPFALLTFIGGSLLMLFKTPQQFPKFCDSLLKGFRLADEIKPFVLIDWDQLWHLPMQEVLQKITKSPQLIEP